ncbi:protein FAM107B-like isoform X3 [Scophthalmus maximus]|uniref:protein FAM107B-like isoform X3 n=1 Tax=Scophthalmus maximus TaxID=52904 RepID=UPI001FA90256|nr:protein FAM107B-like isoform X3 [Scophthalmus maximus]XP_047188780.1 protein FAM107B-like isoform X3 [Scophthalmus maximus]XP_047188781.1 protein FAM107B-like isoform X3 [Scophthalmus maximus]
MYDVQLPLPHLIHRIRTNFISACLHGETMRKLAPEHRQLYGLQQGHFNRGSVRGGLFSHLSMLIRKKNFSARFSQQCVSTIAHRCHKKWVFEIEVIETQQQEDGDLIRARKLPNPVLASHQCRALHQELLFCHRRGLLPKRKSELQLVLEHKQREQHKQGELALHPPSDFEEKLRAMQQRIQVCELEEKKRNESLQDVPEFVRVRGTLKHVQTFSS